MRRVSYSIGYITRYIRLSFSIQLRDKMNKSAVNQYNETLVIGNLYPSLTLSIQDELRDDSYRQWSLDKMISFSRFTSQRFVNESEEFIRRYKEEDLFRYRNQELLINQQLADSMAFVEMGEWEKQIYVVPTKGKDAGTGAIFEGVKIMISNISNEATLSFFEFQGLIDYMKNFDFDGMALKLLNSALILSGNSSSILTNDVVMGQNTTQSENVMWVDKPNTIPKL